MRKRTVFLQPGKAARALVAALATGLITLSLAGCGTSDSEPITAERSGYQVDDESAAPSSTVPGSPAAAGAAGADPRGTMPEKPPTLAADELRDLRVPDGGRDELVAFLDEVDRRYEDLRRGRVQGLSMEGVERELYNIMRAKRDVSQQLLEENGLDEQTRHRALQSKLIALSVLAGPQDEQATEQLRDFADELVDIPEMEIDGRLIRFGLYVDDVFHGKLDDSQLLLGELQAILETDRFGQAEMRSLRQAAQALFAADRVDLGIEVMKQIRDALRDHPDSQLRAASEEITQQLHFVDYKQQFTAVVMDEPDADIDSLRQAAQQFIGDQADLEIFRELSSDAVNLEYGNQMKAAGVMYELIREHFVTSDDPAVADEAQQLVANADKRINLLDQPLEITGVTRDGQPLQWSDLEGKVVLVDFWATWCGPCRAKFPQLRETYDRYKDQGFEIVGVNLDDDPQQLDTFLQEHDLPWIHVRSEDESQSGFNDPNAVRLGVEAIPFLVLIGQDGNVAALHTRGQQLDQKLQELLGEPPVEATSKLNEPRDVEPVTFVALHEEGDAEEAERRNPYLAPAGLSDLEVADFLLDMKEKPQSIRRRAGFWEAVAEAADRLLRQDAPDRYRRIAAEVKFAVLHEAACLGDDEADAKLMKSVTRLAGDEQEQIAADVRFFQRERRALDADQLTEDQIRDLLADLKQYFESEELTSRHLRLASATTAAINRLEDGEQREQYFQEFGKLLQASDDSLLAGYGRRLAAQPRSAPQNAEQNR